MFKVLIVVDQPVMEASIASLLAAPCAQRDWAIYLLHVVPLPPVDALGRANTVVLEEYLSADRCDDVVTPLLHHLGHPPQNHHFAGQPAPRLVPRHLIHDQDLTPLIDRCGLAQQRRDSINLLAAYVQELERLGIAPSRVIRDSAIGAVTTITGETAAHVAADLVVAGERTAGRIAYGSHPSGSEAHQLRLPCPLLILPSHGDAGRSGMIDATSVPAGGRFIS
jgi:nucleotide-binding universal stress UspA family protein